MFDTTDEAELQKHLTSTFNEDKIFTLRNEFSKHGFIRVRNIVDDTLREKVAEEVHSLISREIERRDLKLSTTDNTPRYMSVVRSEFIAENSLVISELSKSVALLDTLSRIAGSNVIASVSKDEEFLITKQDRKGDTHGWHWGDYSFALIWIIETPSIDQGGMLQCIPHTTWDKTKPRVHDFLCNNPISTYGFVTGDIYFLRTDTTLHRTIPLNTDVTRIILNMTYADEARIDDVPHGDDRWWENQGAGAVTLQN